jgi:hypothetical protein
MKKIIAISVMFALFAGAVFAETSVSGGVETRFTLIDGVSQEGSKVKPKMYGSISTANMKLSGANEEGTLGGAVKIRMEDLVGNGNRDGQNLGTPSTGDSGGNTNNGLYRNSNVFHQAFVWWKPIPQLNIFLGIDPDGKFGTDPLASWGYHKGAEGYMNNHDWGVWRSLFIGNWDTFGLALSIYPMDGLDINIVIPTGAGGWPYQESGYYTSAKWRLDEMFIAGLRLNINYQIEGIGKLFISYLGANANANGYDKVKMKGNFDNDNEEKSKQPTNGTFGLSFLLTMVEGFQIQPAVAIELQNTSGGGSDNTPIIAGFAVHYDGEGFGAKARLRYVMNAGGNKDASILNFSIMPWYAMEGMTIFFDFGSDINMVKGVDTVVPWFINPYITVPISGGKFQAGVKINSNGAKVAPRTTYSIPLLLGFNF